MRKDNRVFGWLPCSVIFVGTTDGEQRDIMTATAMFVSEKAPLLVISVSKNHLTARLIEQSGEFTLSIASQKQKELAVLLGSAEGKKEDKFSRFSIRTIPNGTGKLLIPEESAAWMECKVVSLQEIDGYRLVIGRVVDKKDLGKPPLIWHEDMFFSLKPL
ncbi:MAG: flavin reductase family protein [Desulfatiglandaceae bacterium]